MKKSLKQASQTYFDQHDLDETSLERFESMLAKAKIDEPLSVRRRSAFSAAFVAAFAFLCIGFGLFSYLPSGNVEMDIAREVAMNHIKMKPLEVEASGLAPIRDYFTQLDFSIVESRRFVNQNILGGRYCSIKGVTAAQLRYQTADTGLVTLYEVGYDKEIFADIPNLDQGESPKRIVLDGLSIELWLEKGLLMASVTQL